MNNWCKHEWIANSGRGEEPVYRLNSQMGAEPIMHARCKVCEDRTWFTEQQWNDEKNPAVTERPIDGLVERRVVCAAIRNDKNEIICSSRHWDRLMCDQVARSIGNWRRAEQGFVDQFCVWMNRGEARKVATKAGQIIRRCGRDEENLYSENLY